MSVSLLIRRLRRVIITLVLHLGGVIGAKATGRTYMCVIYCSQSDP